MGLRVMLYELRMCGKGPMATILVSSLLIILVALVAHPSDIASSQLSRLLNKGYPLAVGLAVAQVASSERMPDLHLTSLVPLRVTLMRRLVILFAFSIVGAYACITALSIEHLWQAKENGLLAIVQPGPSIVFLASVAVLAGVRTFNNAAASTAVMTAWLFQVMLLGPYADGGSAEVGVFTILSLILLGAAIASLGQSERILMTSKVTP